MEERWIVLYNFTPKNDDELAVMFHDVITILEDLSDVEGWVIAECRGNTGKLPKCILHSLHHYAIGIDGIALEQFRYENNDGTYLEFNEGDTVLVIDRPSDGWCAGFCNDRFGLFPEGFLSYNEQFTINDIGNLIIEMENDNIQILRLLVKTIEHLSVSSTSIDVLVWPLIKVFHHRDKFFTFFDMIVEKEVRGCLEAGILFRKNSLVSKIFMRYVREVCGDYLKDTLVPIIEYITQSDGSFELDPTRIGEDEDVEKNQNSLIEAAKTLLEKLLDSVDTLHVGIRHCFYIIRDRVIEKFPQSVNICVGGFYFLRMICPIIAGGNFTTIGLDVQMDIDSSGRRKLVIMSKLLQTLANEVNFGAKEKFMMPLNDKMAPHVELCAHILKSIPTEEIPDHHLPHVHDLESKQILKLFHSWMCKEEMTKRMYNSMKEEKISKDLFIQFRKTILGCGIPLPDAVILPQEIKYQSSSQTQLEVPATRKISKKQAKKLEKEEELRKKELEKKKKIEAERLIKTPEGKLLCGTYLKGRHESQKTYKNRFYALYSESRRIFIYDIKDDMPNNAKSVFDLSDNFKVNTLPKNNTDWEFSISTGEQEYFFSTSEESDYRRWLINLDARTSSTKISEEKARKQELAATLQEKLRQLNIEFHDIKSRLRKNYDNPDEADTSRLEELVITIQSVTRTLNNL